MIAYLTIFYMLWIHDNKFVYYDDILLNTLYDNYKLVSSYTFRPAHNMMV